MENLTYALPSLHPSNGRGPRAWTARAQDRGPHSLKGVHPTRSPTPQPASSRGQTGKGACVALERGKQTQRGQSRWAVRPPEDSGDGKA